MEFPNICDGHIRFFPMEIIEKTKQRRLGSIQRSLAYQPSALPLRHTFTSLASKKRYKYFCSIADEYCLSNFVL
jgi:hypothetical protein